MRRRGLFAGLAGLLAAPNVAAAAPTEPAIRWSHWISGETVELNTSWHAVQRMHGKVEWTLPDGLIAHEVHIVGAGGQSSGGAFDALPGDEMVIEVAAPAPGLTRPIGVTWAGFQDPDPDPRAPVSPTNGLTRVGGGEVSPLAAALPTPHSLHLHSLSFQGPDTPDGSTGAHP